MRESRNLEYKEKITNTFLKTVSAFANYGTGNILFGVLDDGTKVGVEDPESVCLDIENRINDSISPVPQYYLTIEEKTSVINLTVKEGIHKPYLYKAKAYRRNDTASVEADRMELMRLLLEGQNLTFEEMESQVQDLTFNTLQEKLKAEMKVSSVTQDILKTLELYSDEKGYNIAAELLADNNSFCGIDIVRFGDSMDILRERKTLRNISVIDQYEQAVEMYSSYYKYDQIRSIYRETIEIVPEKAFREAVANALVHRTWDIDANISISMFEDRIEIVSPGGLPRGLNEKEYLGGGISILRNRILGNVFFRLHMIEHFGTGIKRIQQAYDESLLKPRFIINDNSICVVLPVLESELQMTEDEKQIYCLVRDGYRSSSEIAAKSDFGKTKTVRILKSLEERGYINQNGVGRGTYYTVKM